MRLLKRDLLFVCECLAMMLDENHLTLIAKQHGIKKAKDTDAIGKLLVAYLRRANEGALGRIVVELAIVVAASRSNGSSVLKDAAAIYKVDIDAIAANVKQEFVAREKARAEKKPSAQAPSKAVKKAKAA